MQKEQKPKVKANGKLAKRFTDLDTKRASVLRRCEDYAMWTLPYLFPPTNSKDKELQGPLSSTGARAVNFLSNKLTMTLFQQQFFRLKVSSDELEKLSAAAKQGDPQAKELLSEIDSTLVKKEREAIQELGYNKFRTEATTSSKHVIVTGNALMYMPPKTGDTQVYGLRDYCVVRDLSGNVIEFIMRDRKALCTFNDKIISTLKELDKHKYKDDADVTLYTRVMLKSDGKYHLEQDVENVNLDYVKGQWTKEDLPWIILTWNLVRGEDYGRGLVEDYAGSFHALYVLHQALITGVAIASDIKFLVDPSSVIDVRELNDSASGSYHSGKEGDVSCVQLNKALDFAMVEAAIERITRDISQAFLLNSSVPRDAERVTAEEIRFVAQELETAHGGVYSRFSEEWQYRVAVLILSRVDIKIGATIRPQILTGLENLSRSGELDNLVTFIKHLSLLNEVPEEFRGAINPRKYAAYVGMRTGVEYDQFIMSDDEMMQKQQAEQQAMNQQLAIQGGMDVATAAGKEAVKGNNNA